MTGKLPDSEAARIVTRAMPTADRRAVGLADIMALGVLLAGTPVASVSSSSQLRAMAARAARLLPAGFRQEARLETFVALGGFSPGEAVALRRRQLEHRLTSLAFFIKQLVAKSPYEIIVEGREHVDEALAGGRGAVIWIADFVFASEVVRQAFHVLGHPLTHMIRPEHGFSSTQVGLKYLNPVHRKAGDRYVREYAWPSPAAPSFTVSIGRPLTMKSADRHSAILEATKDFVSQLAPRVEANPELWRGWPSLT
ncbi:hypothetical protein G5V57_21440 [Nordella sp. HKS 07]|uniref:hypothetical protein n=1 Tax=Nordella sp. HKS 07 TaxID=2712222 RepID=UPI0013E1A6C1|nr:hypothetical protein [Nordella sp. HKS 07]QIG50056.1 hypothetical protein G5V57_21440 [Nordella sp. HKS 07]